MLPTKKPFTRYSLSILCTFCCIIMLTCGKSASASTKLIDSCTMVSIETVDSIVGSAVKRPPTSSGGENKKYKTWSSYCSYEAPGNKTRVSFQLQNFIPVGKATEEQWFDTYAKNMSGGKMEPVDNVGAKAYWIPSIKSLVTYQDDLLLTLSTIRRGASVEELFSICRKLGVEAMNSL